MFSVCAFAALAQFLLRDVATRPTVVGGASLLVVGSLITAGTITADSLAGFLAGSVLVGLGFGAAFMGALRSSAAQLPSAHRAGVMSAFFVVAYTAISIPAIGAGVATVHIGIASAAALVRLRCGAGGRRRGGHRLVRAALRRDGCGRLPPAAPVDGALVTCVGA